MTEIKPVAWTNEAQLGFVKDPKWSGIPMAMWGERENYAEPDVALCRHDEAMAEIERLAAMHKEAFDLAIFHQSRAEKAEAETERLRKALRAMLMSYGPPDSIAALCQYPDWHPISLARAALAFHISQSGGEEETL